MDSGVYGPKVVVSLELSISGMVHPERLELPTSWFEAMRSIQLSYGCMRAYTIADIVSCAALRLDRTCLHTIQW